MTQLSLAENFKKYFSVRFANSKALRQAAFQIRHSVYCEELGWEALRDNKMETDEYDQYAFHCLLEHKSTGVFAGCVRVVIPPLTSPEKQTPLEKNCLDSLLEGAIDPRTFRRGSFGEISRLAVPSAFRRRPNEKDQPFIINDVNMRHVFSEEERRNFPNIAMGLYLASIALVQICNHDATFVMMEPRLQRRLDRLGLPFQQVGEAMDYHGLRALFYLPSEHFTSHLNDELLELFNTVKQDLLEQVLLVPFVDPTDF
ncbi:PEP-CTERM/exosortase system-associated acyltransferase [Flocculibacter collagenilyticus]|uniref:PEP-CTERM/exosortase system-associated acyltransferase n=1 Tax=Flocculibacter collagenilyticus TaxID=2744479 RepID=UPI0018F66DC3|nr:PEP-CTERM/exosortase system-associated acyltransferase [Flocculibacter collagenilyticus]